MKGWHNIAIFSLPFGSVIWTKWTGITLHCLENFKQWPFHMLANLTFLNHKATTWITFELCAMPSKKTFDGWDKHHKSSQCQVHFFGHGFPICMVSTAQLFAVLNPLLFLNGWHQMENKYLIATHTGNVDLWFDRTCYCFPTKSPFLSFLFFGLNAIFLHGKIDWCTQFVNSVGLLLFLCKLSYFFCNMYNIPMDKQSKL